MESGAHGRILSLIPLIVNSYLSVDGGGRCFSPQDGASVGCGKCTIASVIMNSRTVASRYEKTFPCLRQRALRRTAMTRLKA